MFEFHRVGWINGDNKQTSGWYCYITKWEQMMAYFEYSGSLIAHAWMDVKNSPDYKMGHCRTTMGNVAKTLLQMKMEKDGKKQMSMPNCINYLDHT